MQTYEVLFDASNQITINGPSGEIINNVGKAEGLTTLGEGRDEVLAVDKTLFREELTRLMSKFESLNAYEFLNLYMLPMILPWGIPTKKSSSSIIFTIQILLPSLTFQA